MEAPFDSGSALRYGVMSDEQICVQRELCQSVSFAVRISTENDSLAAHFHPPCQRGKPTMNHAYCVHAMSEFRNTRTGLEPATTSCGSSV